MKEYECETENGCEGGAGTGRAELGVGGDGRGGVGEGGGGRRDRGIRFI